MKNNIPLIFFPLFFSIGFPPLTDLFDHVNLASLFNRLLEKVSVAIFANISKKLLSKISKYFKVGVFLRAVKVNAIIACYGKIISSPQFFI